MKKLLDRSKFQCVTNEEDASRRAEEFLSYIGDQIRHEDWQVFHDDVLSLPAVARRLYLAICFEIGSTSDGIYGAFSFYGYRKSELINEIALGYKLLDLEEVSKIVEESYVYWSNPNSPSHSADVPWMQMDEDLNDVHGRYYALVEKLFVKVGCYIREAGEDQVHA